MVDHHDSYTHNLTHLIAGVTGELPAVVQHDEAGAADLAGFTHVVLSPGPGHPARRRDFALGTGLLRAAATPILGVCLGMQGLVTAYGGRVDRTRPAHGEVASVSHRGLGVFAGIPTPFAAVRYHSLAAVEVPAELEVTARSEDGVVMGVRHRLRPLEGVQFHPESVASEYGDRLIANFLELR
ncbi:MAG: aminodeoxychorismate/anthranilate synthase component II [Nocardioides sp.]|uniref:anthranilate synthase component II n=1 Tax=Nocardioides sp. TaxID=35761 RepID=UPI0039E62062